MKCPFQIQGRRFKMNALDTANGLINKAISKNPNLNKAVIRIKMIGKGINLLAIDPNHTKYDKSKDKPQEVKQKIKNFFKTEFDLVV
jgi:hypothetical protein